MSSAFDKSINHVMLYEIGGFFKLTSDVEAGLISTKQQRQAVGYVNDPNDRGGETKFGIAKNANPDLNISALTWAQANTVYFNRYWIPAQCDKLPGRYAVLHFDVAVNHGVKRANLFLQHALGVTADGSIGPITLAKVLTVDVFDLITNVSNIRKQFYLDLVVNDPSQAKYKDGWIRRCDEVESFTLDKSQDFS